MGVPGEDRFCDARRAVRIPPPKSTTLLTQFRIRFRRLYFDGDLTGRFEIGLVPLIADFATPANVGNLLREEILVVSGNGEVIRSNVGVVGKTVATVFANASLKQTGTNALPRAPNRSVRASGVAIFVSLTTAELQGLVGTIHHVAQLANGLVKLAYSSGEYHGERIPIYYLAASPYSGTFTFDEFERERGKELRAIRLAMIRLYAETRALRHLIAEVDRSRNSDSVLAFDKEQLGRYIASIVKRLGRAHDDVTGKYGSEVFAAVMALDKLEPAFIDGLLDQLDRLGLHKRTSSNFGDLLAKLETSDAFNKGVIIVNESKDTYNVGTAGIVGPNASNNTVSVNVQPATKELIQALQQLAAEMEKRANSPEEKVAASNAASAAQALAKQPDATGESISLAYLKSAGKFALDIAKDIGVKIAVEFSKKALGLP